MGYELLESVKKSKINKEKEINGITPENFKEKWGEILPNIPKTIKIPYLEKKKYVFPTFKRSQLRDKVLGIHVE